MLNINSLLNREINIFHDDLSNLETEICNIISSSNFLILGGAGTIGSAVVKEIFQRNPRKIHVVDINENNLTELVRDIRSSYGYIDGEFKTYAIDIGSDIFDSYFSSNKDFDYVFNLSALKHVRSEKDIYTLMRLIEVNIINTVKTISLSKSSNVKKYFCVSTDKAANPINLMGASKRIMEMFLASERAKMNSSMARFANVAFSDGSLLFGFQKRIEKMQPIAAPIDIMRYFMTPEESGQLCLLSGLFGNNGEIFFPTLTEKFKLIGFNTIAKSFLSSLNKLPLICESEEEARIKMKTADLSVEWPCFFSRSDTTGEKNAEEFFTENEKVNSASYRGVSIIENTLHYDEKKLNAFLQNITSMRSSGKWEKGDIIREFNILIPEMEYIDIGKYLDEKM